MEQRLPERVNRDRRMLEELQEHLVQMGAIVESRHISIDGGADTRTARKLKHCVAILVWEEPDGTERTEVVGDERDSHLHLKGLLHDGIYLLAHEGDESFIPR